MTGPSRPRRLLPCFVALTLLAGVLVAYLDREDVWAADDPPARPSLPAGAVVDYQIGGAYRPADGVTVVVRDRTEPADPTRYSVCYVNVFQTQPGTLRWWRTHHPSLLLKRSGRLVRDPGWPDEVLLDQRTAAKRRAIAAIAGGWFRGCRAAGYDAIEADNLDAWTRSRGLLTKAQTISTARAA